MAANNNSGGASEDTRTVVTVLLLLFFTPAGLILMWVWTKWKTWLKVLITALVVIPLILFFTAIAALFGLAASQTGLSECRKQCQNNSNTNACLQVCLKEATSSPTVTQEE
jgi:hypothetical protein